MGIKKKNEVFESGPMSIDSAKVDKANGIVKHVKLLGVKSKNGRDYSKVMTPATAAVYENSKIYTGHPDKPGQTRNGTYGLRIARAQNCVAEADGIYGDLRMNPKHPLSEAFMWEAENDPSAAGLSHHADLVYSDHKQSIVESISSVHSVDIVDSPATTKGIFENEEPVKTFKQVLESLPTDNKIRAVFEEMMAGGVSADMPVDAPVGGSSDEAIKAAFKSAMAAAFDDDSLDLKATIAKIKDIVTSYYKLTEKPAPKDPPADPPAETKTESVEAKLTRLERTEEVRGLAEKEGVKLEPMHLKAAVALESADDRAAFVKSLPKPVVESKNTVAKPRNSTSVLENADDAPAPPTFKDNESRLAFLRGQ